jgi:hypothetical protein
MLSGIAMQHYCDGSGSPHRPEADAKPGDSIGAMARECRDRLINFPTSA